MVNKRVMYTEFMDKLRELLLNRDKKKYSRTGEHYQTSESTADMYITYLSKLNGGFPFDNLNFLNDFEGVNHNLERYAVSSKKTVLASVLATLNMFKGDRRYTELINHYEKMLNDAIQGYRVSTNQNERTEKQKMNWVTLEEVNDKYSEMYEEFQVYKNSDSLSLGNYIKLLSLVILSLYTTLAPRRSTDYIEMFFSEGEGLNNQNKNFYNLSNDSMVFNRYKTNKNYGQQVIQLDEEQDGKLLEVLHTYFKFHPLLNGSKGVALIESGVIKGLNDIPFLVSSKGGQLYSPDINKVFKKIFDGKNVGPSLLRSIHTTYVMSPMIDELGRTAGNMGTSVNELMNVYNKSN